VKSEYSSQKLTDLRRGEGVRIFFQSDLRVEEGPRSLEICLIFCPLNNYEGKFRLPSINKKIGTLSQLN